MITYFKHSNGEAFSLDGEDYVGYFHIIDGKPFTGKYENVDTQPLTSKNTTISDIYTGIYELDTNYNNIPKITPYFTNTFDLLDKRGLEKLILTIDANNLRCFKSMILGNPTIYKFEESNGKYYGLSSVSEELPTSIPQKTIYRGHISPFSSSEIWKFLDNVSSGEFVVDSFENFKYICTDGETDYVLSGNFIQNTPLDLIYTKPNIYFDISSDKHDNPDYTYNIHHDIENDKFLFVKMSSIEIYDASNYNDCNKLILIDRISIGDSTFKYNIWNRVDESASKVDFIWGDRYSISGSINPKFIKFGKNIRSQISNGFLYLLNKYSSDIYQSINLTKYNITDIYDIDLRVVDDYVVILHKVDNNLMISFFDPTDIINTFKTNSLYSINSTLDDYKVKFSNIDSNIFFVYSKLEYQSRYISNPEYPYGRLETCDLMYPKQLIWNTTNENYNFVRQKWNNIKIPSNSFNNLIATEKLANNKLYMILHNIGRIYTLNQTVNDRFLTAIPLDLEKYFEDLKCSQTSLGLYLNSTISNLLKDTLNMFSNASSSFTIAEKEIMLKQLENIVIDTNNLYINGNETINAIALQRIMSSITGIQSKLLPDQQ